VTPWLPEETSEWGGRPVARTVTEAVPRQRAVLSGWVRRVQERRSPTPACDALLDDGTGTITLRWLGRAEVPGISAGASVTVQGTVVDHHGLLVLLNPLYRFDEDRHGRSVSRRPRSGRRSREAGS
jgi:hypothetical protein